MGRELTHDEISELLGAYALDAVSPGEAEEVEYHLEECPRCRAEVGEHREAAAMLAHAGAAAPDGVWDRIAASLTDAPPQLDLAPVRSIHSSRRRVSARAVMTGAAVAAAVFAVLGVQIVRQEHRISSVAAQVSHRGGEPGARRIDLASADGQITAEAILLRDGQGYLVRHNLPTLAADQTYQLWGVVGNHTLSLGLLGSDPGVVAFAGVGQVRGLAVTAEQSGGVTVSRNVPIMQGPVSSS